MKTNDIIRQMAEEKSKTPVILEDDGVLLVPMRITGTGEKVRQTTEGEMLFDRPAEIFLGDEFAKSCISVPVVVNGDGEHPLDAGFDKTVGVIAETFVDGSELWGVCRITDSRFFEALQKGDFSTSPYVRRKTHKDGETIIESDPELVHLAIVTNGFWDSEKPAIGGIKEHNMTEEEKKEILDSIGGLSKQLDSLNERITAIEEKKEEDVKDTTDEPVKDHTPEQMEELNKTLAAITETVAKLSERLDAMEAATADSVEPVTEEDEEREELIETISNIADSAKGIVEIKRVSATPRAKKSDILKKFIAENLCHVSEENKGFGEVLDSKNYRVALHALDDIRNAIEAKKKETEPKKESGFAR